MSSGYSTPPAQPSPLQPVSPGQQDHSLILQLLVTAVSTGALPPPNLLTNISLVPCAGYAPPLALPVGNYLLYDAGFLPVPPALLHPLAGVPPVAWQLSGPQNLVGATQAARLLAAATSAAEGRAAGGGGRGRGGGGGAAAGPRYELVQRYCYLRAEEREGYGQHAATVWTLSRGGEEERRVQLFVVYASKKRADAAAPKLEEGGAPATGTEALEATLAAVTAAIAGSVAGADARTVRESRVAHALAGWTAGVAEQLPRVALRPGVADSLPGVGRLRPRDESAADLDLRFVGLLERSSAAVHAAMEHTLGLGVGRGRAEDVVRAWLGRAPGGRGGA
ncbi:hypothetical protein TeGR_g4162 [Tetraparma gracilis]|uniref:Uncharacterized protein n=1 Tax=Tetraparma gracilis TaxID=2962635 RepID=A0ABQ6MCN1_9STRA|nr:hypothetical protein TeGR_g4162 [Tetraparma gracilis]